MTLHSISERPQRRFWFRQWARQSSKRVGSRQQTHSRDRRICSMERLYPHQGLCSPFEMNLAPSSLAPASAASKICARLSLRAACRPPLRRPFEFIVFDLAEFDPITYVHPCPLLAGGTDEQLNRMAGVSPSAKTFTPKHGQYLAYIHLYTRLTSPAAGGTRHPAIFWRYTALSSPNGADARTWRLHQTATGRRSQYRSPRRSETLARVAVIFGFNTS